MVRGLMDTLEAKVLQAAICGVLFGRSDRRR